MRIKSPDEINVLVNKELWLDKEYIPKDLISPKVSFLPDTNPEAMLLRKEAAKAFEKLFKKAEKERCYLYAVSGYRSFKRQRDIFKSNLKETGEVANKYSARPGQSEHQTGLAMDVTCESINFSLSDEFENTKEYEWLCNNSYKFGFIIRYPKGKETITGYNFEPWHLRYVGDKIAEEIFVENITLEEYLNKKTIKNPLFF